MTESRATEHLRMMLTASINSDPKTREELEKLYPGDVYDTQELGEKFIVHGFLAPFVSVTRKSDGVKGLLTFQHSPRFYYDFTS